MRIKFYKLYESIVLQKKVQGNFCDQREIIAIACFMRLISFSRLKKSSQMIDRVVYRYFTCKNHNSLGFFLCQKDSRFIKC